MKVMLKSALGWSQKSASERAEIVQRFDLPRYRLIYLVAHFVCLLPIPLRFLLRACLSDKHQIYQHLYGYTYGRLFGRFKYRPVKLLEIGIGGYGRRLGGESLNAWQAYFPFARIVGCDIQPKQQLATFRTRIYQLDQSSQADLDALREQEKAFDIIIDDGSHLNAHQIFTFGLLFPALKRGGIYVVEDVQTSYWSHGGWDGAGIGDPAFATTCVGYFLDLAKYLNHSEFTDFRDADPAKVALAKSIKQITFECNLIIILKDDNTHPSNVVGR